MLAHMGAVEAAQAPTLLTGHNKHHESDLSFIRKVPGLFDNWEDYSLPASSTTSASSPVFAGTCLECCKMLIVLTYEHRVAIYDFSTSLV